MNLGVDITKEFNGCHNADEGVLSKLPIVGTVMLKKRAFSEGYGF